MDENAGAQIGEMARRLFADLADPQTVIAAGDGWQDNLWNAAEEMLLPRAWALEAFGGVGLSATECVELAAAAGAFALGVPLIETMVAHHWVARAGLEAPAGALSLAPARLDETVVIDGSGRLSGMLRDVPWTGGPLVIACAQVEGLAVALVAPDACAVRLMPTHDGSQRASLQLDGVVPLSTGSLAAAPTDVIASAATMRAAQIGGALRAMLDLSVDYSGERKAFGRTISKFQAVQHQLARIPAAVESTGLMVEA